LTPEFISTDLLGQQEQQQQQQQYWKYHGAATSGRESGVRSCFVLLSVIGFKLTSVDERNKSYKKNINCLCGLNGRMNNVTHSLAERRREFPGMKFQLGRS
jgi:hypothetical protein